VRVDAAQVHTNLVFCSVEETADRTMSGLVEFLGSLGIATYPPGWWGLRFATSSRVDADDVRALAAAVREYLG
jgi:threonine aldolase